VCQPPLLLQQQLRLGAAVASSKRQLLTAQQQQQQQQQLLLRLVAAVASRNKQHHMLLTAQQQHLESVLDRQVGLCVSQWLWRSFVLGLHLMPVEQQPCTWSTDSKHCMPHGQQGLLRSCHL
jgi:hypothetical protein